MAETKPATREVYDSAFDTMARALDLDGKPELIAELKEKTGYDRKHPAPSYSPEVTQAVMDLLARRCFSGMPLDDAYERFGGQAFGGYRATLVGRVVLAALSMVSVERALRLALRSFQGMANFTRHEVIHVSDEVLVYRAHSSIMHPRYLLGVLKELMLGSRNPEVKVELTEHTLEHTDYTFTLPSKGAAPKPPPEPAKK